ncbi:hypothetical protein VA7868_03489 [Vibrio aerogenes CECT 7868]|uniref:Choice-of-anchor I domain-containing protein n=1 Tax=Vibrio aerogenes CECT 7868 TaxID=1216006 RepID=A0A1M6A658_9VIBR|nr:choice-of-anchor I family protein [Vibrio aerogenes]SHI31960.1 hypothetical protein VA7868_03489 [Vibrio aerogenes CECT 7868]
MNRAFSRTTFFLSTFSTTIVLGLTVVLAGCVSHSGTSGSSALSGQKVSLHKLGRYQTRIFDESAAEIAAYSPKTQSLYVVDGGENSIDVIDISDPASPVKRAELQAGALGSGIQSVDVAHGLVAVAVENKDSQHFNRQNNGLVAFFDVVTNQPLGQVTVGSLPDMVKFTKDGQKLLVANEGEPCLDYLCDPKGSVSVIDLSRGVNHARTMTLGFDDFSADALRARQVRIRPGSTPAEDLEPEYITISDDNQTAWVALQENNALAVIDLKHNRLKTITGLGYKNHALPGQGLDGNDKDKRADIRQWPVMGMYQPDGISGCRINGRNYVLTANEGDGREYSEDKKDPHYNPAANDEVRIADVKLDPDKFPNAQKIQHVKHGIGRLKIARDMGDTDGDGDYDQLYSFGARSFSIFDADGRLVSDSGDDFEQITAQRYPKHFNASNTKNKIDNRSDNKGPEPENVVCYQHHQATYAFVGLERIGGIMIYNISDPTQPVFVDYINDRDFSAEPKKLVPAGKGGDLGPEGLLIIPAAHSPTQTALLVTANEVSGSTTIYEIR